ncbi:MAG: signal recognition particle subunit SRP19/SEC65 family protein [archaeon]|jgi:signal recognition particle subunit SRP19|nr:signal recognition particle subunit SRP19/SEC65 family protein [archaeon]
MKEVMIWPIYLDSEKSLNEGRKISKEYAIPEPRIKEIVKATQKLRYKYFAEEDKAYPGEWYNKSGRVIITSDESKKEILINLSNTIKEMREMRKENRSSNKKGKKGKRR